LEEEKKTNPKPKSLAEKYNELKDRGNITAGDVATIVRYVCELRYTARLVATFVRYTTV
jgi:hypothetical protein